MGNFIGHEAIETPSIGDILREEFIEPLNISVYKLAKDIHVPTSRIFDILNGKRRVTVETALRLSKYFNTSERFFLNLQNIIDIRKEKALHGELLSSIVSASAN